MLTQINPKLPMRDKNVTREFHINKLGFKDFGNDDLVLPIDGFKSFNEF